MIELVKEIVSYPFMVRAIIVGSLVAVCSALLGVSLVLKRYSMIGDGLSHVGFGALAIAASMNVAPLKVSIPVVVIAAFFLLRMSENSKLKGDAAIAMIYDNIHDYRNEHGCVQLFIRKHIGNDQQRFAAYHNAVNFCDSDIYIHV